MREFFVDSLWQSLMHNSYYVLRTKMLEVYVNDLISILNTRQPTDGWEVSSALYVLTL